MSFDVKYEDRFQKIRGAGAAAIRQLDKLRSTELMTRATFDAEVARIAQENLPPYGCDFVVHRTDGVARCIQSSAHREKLGSDRTFLLSRQWSLRFLQEKVGLPLGPCLSKRAAQMSWITMSGVLSTVLPSKSLLTLREY